MTVFSKLPVMLSDLEDVDIRYENGCIYILKHKTDETKEYYVGSTKDFKQRCQFHKVRCNNQNDKKYNYKVYKYIRENGGWEHWKIVKLYDYPCKNKYKLEQEERRAIEAYKSTLNNAYKSTLNNFIPTRTSAEYRQEHREYYKEYARKYREDNKKEVNAKKRQYHENNKQEINAKRKVKINCENCNSLVNKVGLARHKRSNYCINHK
jgi:hypothetical protein